MDNGKSNIMMHRPQKVPISELNSCITCGLCKGYFIDATTIIECLHTFCRSCIVKYLKANKYCPICDVQVHKTKALLNIRQDKTLQALVYKLVPRLYQDEAKRRKAFYEANPAAKPSMSEEDMAAKFDYILAPDESVEFTLNYDGCSIKPRYIRCSSAVSITHLKKLIHSKYELTDRHKVDVFFKEDNLDSSLSLIDVAYIYSWKRKNPLDLTYKIYECRAKKIKLECSEGEENATSSTNWKEVQLRISENGEMSITGIQESGMLQLLEATENFKSEVVIEESKLLEASEDPHSEPEQLKATDAVKKKVPDLLYFGKGANSAKLPSSNANSVGTVASEANQTLSSEATSTASTSSPSSSETTKFKVPNLPLPKAVELSGSLNLNKELYVMPVSISTNCVSLSCGSTTTVFSTISKSMCSTKSDDTHSAMNLSTESRPSINPTTEVPVSSVLKQSNSLKRKCDEVDKTTDLPTKLSKPTILNHSLGLLNLSNNHPLKKHSKILRTNGERKHADLNDKAALTLPILTVTSEKSDNSPSKPIIINKSLNYMQMNRLSKLNVLPKNVSSGNVPCYMSKVANSVGGKAHEKNGGRVVESSQDRTEGVNSRPPNAHSQAHTPIITPAQLPHRHHLNALKQSVAEKPADDHSKSQNDLQASSDDVKESPAAEKAADAEVTIGGQQLDSAVSCSQSPVIKSKPSTSIGYKTLRDPPKSWNSQINSQIARVNQNVKAQQLANAAAAASQCSSGNAQGRFASDLKTVRPAKFFKGRNMPRYLGNPASGVKPMYQVQVSPEKDKDQAPSNAKPEKSEIKKHSIVKIDPKTLKPISEKAPDTLNLSNLSASLELGATHHNEELRNCSSPGDLKINISSVPIFNPLKLQQNSPKNERKSPKSPHSPKVKSNSSTTAAASTINTSCTSSALVSTLSSRQQRDKTSLTFTPPNPFIPNLGSPTLNPNQFLYPAGGYPSYDPRFMAACHSLWYTQRMAAAAAAGLVPPALPPGFSLNMGVSSSSSTIGQQSYNAGVGPKYSTATRTANQSVPRSSHSKSGRKMKEPMMVKSERSLEVVLEKINQSKVKELMDLKSADKKAMVRNGWLLQRKSSPTDNGDALVNKKEAPGALEKGSPNETTKMSQAASDAKLAEGELSEMPSRDQAANSTDIQREKHSKSPTNQNKPNSSTDTKLRAEFQDERDAPKTEERLQDNNPVRDTERPLLEVAENGKIEASATLREQKQQQPSENGISTCNSEIPKSDVNATDPVKEKEVSVCENSDKEILPNENSDKLCVGKPTSVNDSGDGEKTSNV